MKELRELKRINPHLGTPHLEGTQTFRKTNIFYHMIGVRNFAHVLNE